MNPNNEANKRSGEANKNGSFWTYIKSIHGSRKLFGYIVRGVVLAVSICFVAVGGAWLGFKFFFESQLDILGSFANFLGDPELTGMLYGALGAVSAGLVLALIREFFNIRQHSLDYLRYNENGDPMNGYMHTVLTVLMFSGGFIASAIAYHNYNNEFGISSTEQIPEEPVALEVAGSRFNFLLSADDVASGDGAQSKVSFLLMFYEDATEKAVKTGNGPGVSVSDDQIPFLRSIAETVTACSNGKESRAELIVIGSASSERFDTLPLRRSNQLNLKLANLRAEVVAKLLNEFSSSFGKAESRGSGPLGMPEVKVHKWKSYEDMVRARKFRDRDDNGSYIDERARLTRSVEITVEKAGECEFQRT